MMVDDAHSSGVLGNRGRGTIDHHNCHGRVDIQVGTLSKAIGSIGGYVCGSRDLIDFLHHRGRPFIFSTSHPPSVTATCQAAFELLDSEAGDRLIKKLWSNTKFFKRKLKKLGFNTGKSETPIVPVMIGDAAKASEFSRELFAEGVFVGAISYPTVPEGKARLRAIVTASHKRSDLERALEIFARVGQKLGIV
jgi:glycine C-acetyltransferase